MTIRLFATAAALSSLALAEPSNMRAIHFAQSLSDHVGPRIAGSDGDRRAVAWALEQMKAIGLKNVRAEPVEVPVWVRGVETGELTAPTRQPLLLTALGGSISTPPGGVEGDVIEAENIAALDALPENAVRGKIVFLSAVTERSHTGEGYGKTFEIRGAGAVHAAKKGAVAVVIRSLATWNTRLPHTGAMRYDDKVAKIPAAALSVPDALLVHRLLAEGPVHLKMVLGCHDAGTAHSANVIGEIPGTQHADEILLVGAHLDSWDLATGALDDGAGVGMILEAAAQLAHHPLARTVRFILFANEEHGLSGGFAYAKAHDAEIAKHVGALEMDHGDGAVNTLSFAAGAGGEALLKPIVTELKLDGPRLNVDGGGADLTPLKLAGVPMLELDQDGTKYFDYHHSADDTFDKIDETSLEQAAQMTTQLIAKVASLPGRLAPIPEAERKRRF